MFYCGIANPERQKELTGFEINFEIVFAIGIELMTIFQVLYRKNWIRGKFGVLVALKTLI